MTTAEEAWDDLFRRAAQSRFAGVTAETDDLMGAADLREGSINPNSGSKAPGAGAGGPGMMPPMMGMGGGGGGGGAAAPSGGLGATTATAAPEPAPGVRVAAMQPLEAPTAASAGPGAAEAEPGDLGGTGGGSIGGGGGGSLPEVDLEGAAGSDSGPENQEGGPAGDGSGVTDPAGGGPAVLGGPTTPGDFSVDPDRLRRAADRWYALSDHVRVNGEMDVPDTYGLLKSAPVPGLGAEATAWAQGASAEFRAVGDALAKLADAYLANEETGAALAGEALAEGEA